MINRISVRLELEGSVRPLGDLAERDRRVYFEFAPEFLATPLPISPLGLQPRRGVIEHLDRDFAPVFGVFADSLPDGWGLLLMDREFRRRGLRPAEMNVLDRLTYLGRRTMGALTYHPADEARDEPGVIELQALASEALRVLEGSASDVLPTLRIAGGSPGGARPKVLLGVSDRDDLIAGADDLPPGFEPWLVKFRGEDEHPDSSALEAAYAQVARNVGISMGPTRLFEASGDRFFGMRRFDRLADGGRLHMHTASGLLHADHRLPSLDYTDLVRLTLRLTRDFRQAEEMYRRMVFNMLMHNRDDHAKNFSFLMNSTGEWALSPAYDLVFHEGPGGEHTTSVAGEGRAPGLVDAMRVAEVVGIEEARARLIFEEVADGSATWKTAARDFDVASDLIAEVNARTG